MDMFTSASVCQGAGPSTRSESYDKWCEQVRSWSTSILTAKDIEIAPKGTVARLLRGHCDEVVCWMFPPHNLHAQCNLETHVVTCSLPAGDRSNSDSAVRCSMCQNYRTRTLKRTIQLFAESISAPTGGENKKFTPKKIPHK
eukprot:c24449_g1_i1.p1 GENE.c24449_g1_i1~~c24449_g1_i1.p1  ORF type:complete len:142 (+),score=15.57 c24449_g1_i1:591-1016(+)